MKVMPAGGVGSSQGVTTLAITIYNRYDRVNDRWNLKCFGEFLTSLMRTTLSLSSAIMT